MTAVEKFVSSGYIKALNSVLEKTIELSSEYVSRDLRKSVLTIIGVLNKELDALEDYDMYGIFTAESMVQKDLNTFIDKLIKIFNKQILG